MRIFRSFLVPACLAASCSLPDYTFSSLPVTSCSDGLSNGSETDEDCGGDRCGPCKNGRICGQDRDCEQGSCVAQRCQAAGCVDQALSDDETDVDCGGPSCVKCGVNQRCHVSSDCTSNACSKGRCIATGCDDEVTNRSETDLDCGGGTCPACSFSKRCLLSGDCESGICLSQRCSPESCADGVKSPDESGVDCGGACPTKCASGEGCLVNGDCQSDECSAGRCLGKCSSDALGESGGPYAPCEPMGSGGAGAGGSGPGSAGSPEMEPSGGKSNTAGAAAGGATAGGAIAGGAIPGGTGGVSGASGGGVGGSPAPTTGGASIAGAPAAGGNAGAGAGGMAGSTCPGCAVLSVPLAAPDDRGNYLISLPSVMDFSRAKIRYRIFKKAGTGGQIKGYVQHGGSPDFLQLFQLDSVQLSSVSGWFELVWDVGAQATTYDKTIVGRVGIQVIGLGSSSWKNPTVIYIDEIDVEGPSVGPWLFDDASSVSAEANIGASPNVLWRNAGDDPVAGASVSWFTM